MSDAALASGETRSRLARWAAAWKVHERRLLAATIGLQFLTLLGMIAARSLPLLTGQAVLLPVAPIDPRDLFRGDYVTLSYDFSRIGPLGVDGQHWPDSDPQQWRQRTVYAVLVAAADGKHWKLDRLTFTRPQQGLFLRGRTAGWNQLEFGIESYYVQQGTGHKYEKAARSRRLSAEVCVGADGQALLRRLVIE